MNRFSNLDVNVDFDSCTFWTALLSQFLSSGSTHTNTITNKTEKHFFYSSFYFKVQQRLRKGEKR